MKILCVCRGGNTRSVAAKIILKRYFGHETLAAGIDNNSAETLNSLGEWADMIVTLHSDFQDSIDSMLHGKIVCLHVGNDIWGDPFHEELHIKILRLCLGNKEIRNGKNPTEEAVVSRLRKYREKIALRNAEDQVI